MAHMVKGRQYSNAQSMGVCMLCLNHRDELNRSTLDLDSRQKRQIDVSVTETNSTAQYRSVPYVARVHILRAWMYACYI